MTQATVSSIPAQDVQPIQINPERLAQITVEKTSREYGRITESDIAGNREGILATAKDKNGMVAQQITGDTRIIYNGIAMTVDNAIKHNILRPDGKGSFEEVSPSERLAQQAEAEERQQQSIVDQMAPETDLHEIDPKAPEILENLLGAVHTHGYTIEQIATELVCKRELFNSRTLPQLAHKMGVSVQTVANQLDQVGVAVVEQIKATVKPYGVDPDEFIDWADKQGSRGAAAYAQAFQGNFMSIRSMVAKFKESNPYGRSTSPHVHLTPGGKRVVTLSMPGGGSMQVSEATAIRMKMI